VATQLFKHISAVVRKEFTTTADKLQALTTVALEVGPTMRNITFKYNLHLDSVF
jgi:hypothetical protein